MRSMKLVKRFAAVCAGLLLAGSLLAGCGGSSGGSAAYDPQAVCATYGDTEITASEVSFYVRYMQEQYETMYGGQASGLWDIEVRTYVTLEDAVKESAVNELYQTYVLADAAEEMGISLTDEQIAQAHEAADEFFESHEGAFNAAVGADTEDFYYRFFEQNALAMLVYQSATENIDTVVSDEEARRCVVQVMKLEDSADGYNAEETKDAVLELLEGGSTTEEIAEQYTEQGLSFSEYTIGANSYTDTFGGTAMALEEGAFTAVYDEAGGCWYVVYCSEYMNAEATDNARAGVVSQRRSEAFQEVYAGWRESAPDITVNESVLDSIDFSIPMVTSTGS